jgi:hypothetical protein
MRWDLYALYVDSTENLPPSCRFHQNLSDPYVNLTIANRCSKALYDASQEPTKSVDRHIWWRGLQDLRHGITLVMDNVA